MPSFREAVWGDGLFLFSGLLQAVSGKITGLVMSDAHASDYISIFRDVMASTKTRPYRQQSRRPRRQRLCLVPDTVPSNGIVGLSNRR